MHGDANNPATAARSAGADGAEYLADHREMVDMIVVDLHGNDEATWRRLWPVLAPRLTDGGVMLLYNSHLWRIPEWRTETGPQWVLATQLFNLAYRFAPTVWLVRIALGAAIVGGAGTLAARSVVNHPPIETLRQ